MKYIITESQMEKATLKWMNNKFSPDQLEVYNSKEFPYIFFYKKDGKLVMARSDKHKGFYFDDDTIWNILYEFFGFDDREIESLLKKWIEQTFGLKGYEPEIAQDIFSFDDN